MIISILGNKGALSKSLRKKINSNEGEEIKTHLNNNLKFLVATYSPTLRNDNLKSMRMEIKYYDNLIKNLKSNHFLIYISSQTLELTNFTYYSKSKNIIEKKIKSNIKNYVIVRPGMIFDNEKLVYNLESMQNASNSFLTFLNDYPKTTVCTINDLFDLIIFIIENNDLVKGRILNLGIKKFAFSQLQNIQKKKFFRIGILSFGIIKILSFLNNRLKAYVYGFALESSPSLAWRSTFDKT